jgi:hypothetical protein
MTLINEDLLKHASAQGAQAALQSTQLDSLGLAACIVCKILLLVSLPSVNISAAFRGGVGCLGLVSHTYSPSFTYSFDIWI